jgi:hypothetical protein
MRRLKVPSGSKSDANKKKDALAEQHNSFSYFSYNFVFSPSSHSFRTVL